jgi:hypothetical protein
MLVEVQTKLAVGYHIATYADRVRLRFRDQCRRWRLVAAASSRDELWAQAPQEQPGCMPSAHSLVGSRLEGEMLVPGRLEDQGTTV